VPYVLMKKLGQSAKRTIGLKVLLSCSFEGPFLTALLSKLELMIQNPLYVNLQLTGLLSRLACFPQPLLKSLLLSHSLVFQPSVKSLIQVRHSIACSIQYTLSYRSICFQLE
jgi:hypothetical protein